ncbi:Alkbh3, partial [Symbiodinium necroappetens]
MPAEVRARWLADAMKAVAASEMDASSIFAIAADPDFADGASQTLGARMLRVLRGNSRHFSEEQARVLQETCSVAQRFGSATSAGGSKNEGETDSVLGAEADTSAQDEQMKLRQQQLEEMQAAATARRRHLMETCQE